MSVNLNKLSPQALKAAMTGGTEAWGQHGSLLIHKLYVEPHAGRRGQFRKCHCGCGGKAKFRLMANGVCMQQGCEISLQKRIKQVASFGQQGENK